MIYEWPLLGRFLNRGDDRARIEDWWQRSDRFLALYGRRRVGKSWLFRSVAHGKPTLILVARQVAEATTLDEFATALEPHLGVRPDLRTLPDLIRVLFRAARAEKLLVVIDEFPRLLPAHASGRLDALQGMAAVIEEEQDQSNLKLIVCGSHVAMMESLLSDTLDGKENPIKGRLEGLPVRPLSFWDAREFLSGLDPVEMLERFAIAGGTPRYLVDLGQGELIATLCREVVDPRSALFNEPLDILAQEVRESRVYFSILEQLASGARKMDSLATALKRDQSSLTQYLDALQAMKLIEKRRPLGATANSRSTSYRLADPFFRFWFRFVFPFQEDLAAGLIPEAHFRGAVIPDLADHVANTFEEICTQWTRHNYGERAQQFGAWWGNARNDLRQTGERTSEEIDIVGMQRNRVTVVGECRWRNDRMDVNVLKELDEFKIPALEQGGLKPAADHIKLLFSRGGFSDGLRNAANSDSSLVLVAVDELIDLTRP